MAKRKPAAKNKPAAKTVKEQVQLRGKDLQPLKPGQVLDDASWEGLRVSGDGIVANEKVDAKEFADLIVRAREKEDDELAQYRTMWELASDPTHPCHDAFEWDDTLAGDRYRDQQAALMTRCIKVSVVVTKQKVMKTRLFVTVKKSDDGRKGVTDIVSAHKNITAVEYLQQQALNSLVSWRRRWRELVTLNEMSPVLEHVDKAIEEMQTIVAKAD